MDYIWQETVFFIVDLLQDAYKYIAVSGLNYREDYKNDIFAWTYRTFNFVLLRVPPTKSFIEQLDDSQFLF